MIKRLSLAVAALLLAALAPLGAAGASATVTIADASTTLPAALQAYAKHPRGICVGRLEAAQVRFWANGSVPTSSVGILLEVSETVTLQGQDILEFRAIRTGAVSGTLNVQCTVPKP